MPTVKDPRPELRFVDCSYEQLMVDLRQALIDNGASPAIAAGIAAFVADTKMGVPEYRNASVLADYRRRLRANNLPGPDGGSRIRSLGAATAGYSIFEAARQANNTHFGDGVVTPIRNRREALWWVDDRVYRAELLEGLRDWCAEFLAATGQLVMIDLLNPMLPIILDHCPVTSSPVTMREAA